MRGVRYLAFFLALCSFGCTTSPRESASFPFSVCEAVQAVSLLLEEQEFKVIQRDEAQGIVETAWDTEHGVTLEEDRRTKVSIHVRPVAERQVIFEVTAPIESAPHGTGQWSSSGRDDALEERLLYLFKLKFERGVQ